MSAIALTICLAASGVTPSFAAQGAVSDPNTTIFQGAISQLGFGSTLYLDLQGSVSYRGKTTPFESNLSYSSSTTGTLQTIKAELLTYVNGSVVKRLVADGNTLWAYDFKSHEYSATSYGGSGGIRPGTYATDILNDLNWAASGVDGYLTKLLRQVYSPSNANYASWMPGIYSNALQQDVPIIDPVNPDLKYFSTATDNFYMYNGSPKKTIVFEIAAGGASTNNSGQPVSGLTNIYFNQQEMIAKNVRFTQWVMTPYANVTYSTSLYQAYSDNDIRLWRPVVAPKAVSN